MSEKITVEQVAYHRNGISGVGFYVLTFTDAEHGPMIGIVFPREDELQSPDESFAPPEKFTNPKTAVFQRELLGQGVIAFGENSWRGDNYDHQLREAIKNHERFFGLTD